MPGCQANDKRFVATTIRLELLEQRLGSGAGVAAVLANVEAVAVEAVNRAVSVVVDAVKTVGTSGCVTIGTARDVLGLAAPASVVVAATAAGVIVATTTAGVVITATGRIGRTVGIITIDLAVAVVVDAITAVELLAVSGVVVAGAAAGVVVAVAAAGVVIAVAAAGVVIAVAAAGVVIVSRVIVSRVVVSRVVVSRVIVSRVIVSCVIVASIAGVVVPRVVIVASEETTAGPAAVTGSHGQQDQQGDKREETGKREVTHGVIIQARGARRLIPVL